MATTLGGVTLAEPTFGHDGYEAELADVGAVHEMADGSLVYDYVSSRHKFTLRWKGITATERNAIRTRYLVKTEQAFSPPDESGSYTVLVVPNSWRDSYLEDGGGTARHDCELRLEESARTRSIIVSDSITAADTDTVGAPS